MKFATQIEPNLRNPEPVQNPEPYWLSCEERHEAYCRFVKDFDKRIYRPKPVTLDDVPF